MVGCRWACFGSRLRASFDIAMHSDSNLDLRNSFEELAFLFKNLIRNYQNRNDCAVVQARANPFIEHTPFAGSQND